MLQIALEEEKENYIAAPAVQQEIESEFEALALGDGDEDFDEEEQLEFQEFQQEIGAPFRNNDMFELEGE